MLLLGPFFMALLPGATLLLLTWWLCKKDFPCLIKMLPGIITILVAAVLFYIGFFNIRGFEGAAYGILSFSLLIFSTISFFIVKKITMTQ